jgi:spore germination protein YaaH
MNISVFMEINTVTDMNNGWQYDTGASTHTTNLKHRLIEAKKTKIMVTGHDKSKTQAELIGNIRIQHHGRRILLTDVLYYQSFGNLISSQRINGDKTLHESKPTSWLDVNNERWFNFRTGAEKLMIDEDTEKSFKPCLYKRCY